MTISKIARHRTAIRRTDLSRPFRAALDADLLAPDRSIFDYGCGLGGDLRILRKMGYVCAGWDPNHARENPEIPSDVVNLGYVINVIEDPAERVTTLRKAWDLAHRVLVVAARLQAELKEEVGEEYGDGRVTRLGTFQKFYQQSELREWIDAVLGVKSAAAAPGVFFVFREDEDRQRFLASRFRRRSTASPIPRKSDRLFEQHRELLEELMAFVADRGRLPESYEMSRACELSEALGTIRQAFAVVRRVTGRERWETIRQERAEDLLVHLGLSAFDGRPRFSDLPLEIRRDVRAFFGNYTKACDAATDLLVSAGDQDQIHAACGDVSVGKVTPQALYIHREALNTLPTILRVYEGCARGFVGEVEGANIIKLHRWKPQVSYLAYPDFDRNPHPGLVNSVMVTLDYARVSVRSYEDSLSPPILHRKEEFVPEGYDGREKFARLTLQEERAGLYERTSRIGTKKGWEETLRRRGFTLQGHRLVRAKE